MYLFQIFRSFLPMHNPIGFGASDFVVLAFAILLVALLVAAAFLRPYIFAMASRTRLSICVLFGLSILLRAALLPQSPVPIPSGADDFSYVLLGDTLSHLRLANATHPLHQFFEAVFVLQQPTYASIYPLGQGIVLALGRLLFHNDSAGVLISDAGLCALCYWMLRAWIAPIWAFVGGLLAILEFGPLSSWMNSYWGGAVSACAGCLVFGALPRMRESPRLRYGAVLGAGVALQILTRPFEAVFLALAIATYYVFAFRQNWRRLGWPFLATFGLVSGSLELTAFQNKAVTGSWTVMPYMLSRDQYGVPTTLTFQPNPTPHRALTAEQRLDYQAQSAIHGNGTDTVATYFSRLAYRFRYLRFFLLPPLYIAALLAIRFLREWQRIWVAGTILLLALGANFYPYFFPHYVAALTCLFVLLSVQGLEKLGSTSRLYVTVLCCASFVFWFALYSSGNDAVLRIAAYQSWYYINRGDPQGRIAIESKLAQSPSKQLVFVRYSPFHRFQEWIHNDADIDSARIVWANDLGQDENQMLLRYYPDRKPWLLQPDMHPPALSSYPDSTGTFLSVH